MTSTATSVITAAITAAIISGATMYLLQDRESAAAPPEPAPRSATTTGPPNAASSEHHLFIFIDLDQNNQCRSTTFPPKLPVFGKGKLHWRVIATKEGRRNCLRNNRKVTLRPKPNSNPSPLTPKEPEHDSSLDADAAYPANTSAAPYRYKYDVWLTGGSAADVKLEDPELEIYELR